MRTGWNVKQVVRKFFIAELVFVVVLLVFPLSARAGVFSYVSSILFSKTGTQEATTGKAYNSQTIPLLRAALNIDPNPANGGGDIIVVGGRALLSDVGPSGTLADIEERPATSDQISIYVVREGDTLSQIANMFSVSINTIRWANDISVKESIRPGQTVVILPVSGVRHTVKKGDTLKSIVKKYEGDIGEVMSYNGLHESSKLAVGDVVVIPNGEIPTLKRSATKSSARRRGSSEAVPSIKGYYLRPVSGVRTQGLHGYNAVDIGAPSGTPIVASATGEVIVSRSSGWNGGYGTYIVIRHGNGTQTLYAHNSSNIVYAGDSVIRGQVIGYIGATGRATGPHVHFEIRGARNPF